MVVVYTGSVLLSNKGDGESRGYSVLLGSRISEAMELGQAGNQDYLMFNIRESTDMK